MKTLTLLVTLLVLSSSANAQGVFFIKDGKAGVGTGNPKETLHIKGEDGVAQAFVHESSSVNQRRTLFRLVNNGPAEFSISDGTHLWKFGNRADGFEINKGGTGSTQFRIDSAGSGYFGKNVYANGVKLTSSRTKKTAFETLDTARVLDQISALEITKWKYISEADEPEAHIGPMAEDFAAVFGLSEDNRHISVVDATGVALAGIQGLHDLARAQSARIESLEALLSTREGH